MTIFVTHLPMANYDILEPVGISHLFSLTPPKAHNIQQNN